MVKIENIYGDVKKGRQAGAVYQTLYGLQIRRLSGSRPSIPSPLQATVRQNFKDAVTWIKSLSVEEIETLKQEWQTAINTDPYGTPINWWNFAKQKYMEVSYSPVPIPEPEDLLYFDITYFDKNYFR